MNFQEKHIIRSNIETCPKNHIWYVIMSLKLWNSFLKVDHETLRKNISYGGPFHIRSIILCSTNGFDIAWYFAISSVCSKNLKSLVVIKTEHKSSVLKHTFTKGDVFFFLCNHIRPHFFLRRTILLGFVFSGFKSKKKSAWKISAFFRSACTFL